MYKTQTTCGVVIFIKYGLARRYNYICFVRVRVRSEGKMANQITTRISPTRVLYEQCILNTNTLNEWKLQEVALCWSV